MYSRTKHRYLFTLEVVPLEIGSTYDTLPSHLTLMSRFWSELTTEQLADAVKPLFAQTLPIGLRFGATEALGPKKVTAHMVTSDAESALHVALQKKLDDLHVSYEYPEFVGANHKAHVTQRQGVTFKEGSAIQSGAVYLIEVVNGQRVVRARFILSGS